VSNPSGQHRRSLISKLPDSGMGALFWLAVGWLGLVVFCAVFGALLPVGDPNRVNPSAALDPVLTKGHLLGTDALGRDILARCIAGARVSVFISVVAVSVGLVFGGLLGTAAGFFRGWFEKAVVAITNIMLSFPSLILLLGVVGMVGPSLKSITSVIAILSIPAYVRFSRAGALTLSESGYVQAARMMGTKPFTIIRRELIPNVAPTLFTYALLALGGIIVAEGTLAFLGLSVPPPTATWGGMIAEGKNALDRTSHVALVPSVVMFLTVLSLNLVGDGMRRRFDIRGIRI
jgi:peptide/nickel transport system permease protein